MCCTPTLQLFEKHPPGISASQHHMLGAASGQWNCKNLKTYCGEVVNYILDKTEENLLTASSTASKVSARIKLLQATQSVAKSWLELSSNVSELFCSVVLSIQAWKCQIWPILKMEPFWNSNT
jgi:hypothetical protein